MSEGEPTETQPHSFNPLAHWPYSSDRCRSHLALDLIEDHAIRILARGIRTQRLVAFVGAGASMAYGRLTWKDLMATLFSAVEAESAGADAKLWSDLRKLIWPEGLSDFIAFSEHPLKAQILSDSWERLARGKPAESLVQALSLSGGRPRKTQPETASMLQLETAHLLKDFHGFIDWVIEHLCEPPSKDEPPSLLRSRPLREEYVRESKAPEADAPAGLGAIAQELAKLSGLLDLKAEPVKLLIERLRVQSIGEDSPVRQLILDWGIRRYMTTNYDKEIERGLEALSYRDANGRVQEVQRNQFETLNFGRKGTGHALRFALEGPRRHAAVLHLHGDVAMPETLILTESHYQHLYLDEHPQRDLVSNATLANFAANPMLFVGSDVNEDDVLRPMRQFMSGPGHRRDRMSVALFLATRSPSARALQKANLLLKFGVYAIHVGKVADTKYYEIKGLQVAPWTLKPEVEADWLHHLYTAHDKFKKDLQKTDAEVQNRVDSLLSAVSSLGLPGRIEGCRLDEHIELDFRGDLRTLATKLEDLRQDVNSFEFKRASLLLDVVLNRIMSSFLSAKLIQLREAAQKVIREDTRLALTYDGWPVSSPGAEVCLGAIGAGTLSTMRTPEQISVQTRHAVSFDRPDIRGRFFEIHSSAGNFREGLDELGKEVRQLQSFREVKGRRLLVVCAARGFGKGGQSDRLLAVDGNGDRPYLRQLLDDLGGYTPEATKSTPTVQVIHLNLSFSNELGPIISLVSAILHRMAPSPMELPPVKDQLEMLARGLHQLTALGDSHRLLIVLGNAGVLFSSNGLAKNGQIRRVLRLLRSPRYEQAPFDLLMYVGESQVPQDLRIEDPKTPPDTQSAPSQKESGSEGTKVDPLASSELDMRRRRRLNRLRIRAEPTPTARVIVHPLKRSRFSDVAAAYFHELTVDLAKPESGLPLSGDDLARALYFATGGSRFAQTIILAYLDSVERGKGSAGKVAAEILIKLGDPPSGSAVENAIEVVLDQWATAHQLRRVPGDGVLPSITGSDEITQTMRLLCARLSPMGWVVATEVLWHLSAFSHPVEKEVLLVCPRVLQALDHWLERELRGRTLADDVTNETAIEAVLELLVHWCLLFRVEPRPLPVDPQNSGDDFLPDISGARCRYAPHRHMQRHFLRLMGGRNVEATQWDQFSTSVYASMPDEAPRLRPEVHRTLTEVLETLTRYPVAVPALQEQTLLSGKAPLTRAMVLEADRIRAAYYLVRSTYSLGVVSHLAAESNDVARPCGHMEHYRRLVRWITHAAQYWEETYNIRSYETGGRDGLRWARPGTLAANGATVPWRPMGIFYAGELIWLYNECGVISLAQGKLQDAEQVLTLAEHAARKVEADDSGSLHTRIRIHTALVQIERGRPHRARQILQPIAHRPNGHPVAPLLATAYLGLIEHIGGNYHLAHDQYKRSLDGLRREERSRAVAFVLMNKADLERSMHPTRVDDAVIVANEAISMAQQGDHEDLRIMATLARVRIYVEARRLHESGLFEHLSFAEEYASRMDIPRLACDVHGLRARLLLLQGEYKLSAADATAGLEIAAMYDLKLKKARGLLTLAEIYRHRGEISGARSLAEMGRAIASSCDYYACVRGFQDLELSLNQAPQSDGLIGAGSDIAGVFPSR